MSTSNHKPFPNLNEKRMSEIKGDKTSIKSTLPTTKSVFDDLPDSAYVRESQLVRIPRKPGLPTPLPFSAPTLWRKVKEGNFPQPVKLGPRITGFQVGAIRDWIKEQANKSIDARKNESVETGGPAFPVDNVVQRDELGNLFGPEVSSGGMTLRDYFAAKAMTQLIQLSDPDGFEDSKSTAGWAYTYADAMLEARK